MRDCARVCSGQAVRDDCHRHDVPDPEKRVQAVSRCAESGSTHGRADRYLRTWDDGELGLASVRGMSIIRRTCAGLQASFLMRFALVLLASACETPGAPLSGGTSQRAPESAGAWSGVNQKVMPGSAVVPPVILVVDSLGGVPGVPVTFTVVGGGGALIGAVDTTDADGKASVGTWTLGPQLGVNTIRASVAGLPDLLIRAFALRLDSDLQVHINVPIVSDTAVHSVTIEAAVTTFESLDSVVARVGAASKRLTFFVPNLWRTSGALALDSLPPGPDLLQVTAYGAAGSVADDMQYVRVDHEPTVTLFEPEMWEVIRGALPFSAACMDELPASCFVYVRVNQSPVITTLGTGYHVVGGSVSSAPWDGQTIVVDAMVTDAFGRNGYAGVAVVVERSNRLSALTSVDGIVLDYGFGKELYRASLPHDFPMRLRDTLTGQDAQWTGDDEQTGFVTPSGAVMHRPHGSSWTGRSAMWVWRAGQLTQLRSVVTQSLQVRGDYAVFRDAADSTLAYRLDLATGIEVGVPASDRLLPNGDILYAGGGHVFRWSNGTSTQLTAGPLPAGTEYSAPDSDGDTVLAMIKTAPGGITSYRLGMVEANGNVTPFGPVFGSSPRPFLFRNGWLTYIAPRNDGTYQVRRRAPSGADAEVSNVLITPALQGITTDGAIVFASGTRRYLVSPPGTQQVDISAAHGTLVSRADQFRLLLGRTVFALVP